MAVQVKKCAKCGAEYDHKYDACPVCAARRKRIRGGVAGALLIVAALLGLWAFSAAHTMPTTAMVKQSIVGVVPGIGSNEIHSVKADGSTLGVWTNLSSPAINAKYQAALSAAGVSDSGSFDRTSKATAAYLARSILQAWPNVKSVVVYDSDGGKMGTFVLPQ